MREKEKLKKSAGRKEGKENRTIALNAEDIVMLKRMESAGLRYDLRGNKRCTFGNR